MSDMNKYPDNHLYFKDGFNIEAFLASGERCARVDDISNEKKILILSFSPENISKIRGAVERFTKNGGRRCQINIIAPHGGIKNISLKKLVAEVSAIRYDFLDKAIIRISGLPFCLFSDPESLFFKSSISHSVKSVKCRKCKFNNECDGLPAFYNSRANLSELHPLHLPEEVAIEVDGDNLFLDAVAIRRLVRRAKIMGAVIVRFIATGGYFRNELYNFLKLAKQQGFETRLDISRVKINNFALFAKKISLIADYVIVGVDIKDLRESIRRNEIYLLKKAGVKLIRAITLATEQNVKNLEKIYRFVLLNGVNKWAVNRDVYAIKESRKRIKILIDKLVKVKKDIIKNRYLLRAHMVYAIPFCFDDPVKINFVCTGAKSVDGYERILIRSDGSVVPIHYFNKKVGKHTDLESAWNHSFLKSIRAYKMLPEACLKCFFLQKCKGGSRVCAYNAVGSYKAPDPLMNLSNIKKYGLNF